jgi:hypothetical protein
MRQRKRVLLYSADGQWLSQVAFAIETRQYVSCSEVMEPELLCTLWQTGDYQALVLLGTGPGTEAIVRNFGDALPAPARIGDSHALLVCRRREKMPQGWRGQFLIMYGKQFDMGLFLNRVRLILRCIRGPKPAQKSAAAVEVPA